MKIILLRHEERYELPLFFTSLTEKGIINSKNLSNKINKINPDVIYCSPFLRTIQTIKPYCLDYNKKIRIEYSLYEYIHAEEFTKSNYKHNVTELNPEIYNNISEDYEPLLKSDDLIYMENKDILKHRINNFINYLKKRHQKDIVLLVSHMSVVNMIKNIYDNKTDLEDYFKTGSIYTIDD